MSNTSAAKNKGYTLLFAIVLASIVLSVAAFILTISRKQFILTSAARDSTVAIYSADSGIQCALEEFATWGGTSTPFSVFCNGISQSSAFVAASDSVYPTLGFDMTKPILELSSSLVIPLGSACAKINVYDGYDSANDSHMTVLDSAGYNTYTSGACPNPGPRVEERAISVTYHD